jgi:hypothetical protein
MTIRNRSTKSRSPMCAGTQSPNLSKVSANTPGHSTYAFGLFICSEAHSIRNPVSNSKRVKI